jgi:hypothetical protein
MICLISSKDYTLNPGERSVYFKVAATCSSGGRAASFLNSFYSILQGSVTRRDGSSAVALGAVNWLLTLVEK